MKQSENNDNKPILLSIEEYRALTPIGKRIADFLKIRGQVVVLEAPSHAD